MPSSTGKVLMKRGFLVLGHGEAIFGDDNLLPHPKRAAATPLGVLPRRSTVLVDRHPAANYATRTLLGRTLSRKGAHLCRRFTNSPRDRLYFSDIG